MPATLDRLGPPAGIVVYRTDGHHPQGLAGSTMYPLHPSQWFLLLGTEIVAVAPLDLTLL